MIQDPKKLTQEGLLNSLPVHFHVIQETTYLILQCIVKSNGLHKQKRGQVSEEEADFEWREKLRDAQAEVIKTEKVLELVIKKSGEEQKYPVSHVVHFVACRYRRVDPVIQLDHPEIMVVYLFFFVKFVRQF